jgi:hypothetical protein
MMIKTNVKQGLLMLSFVLFVGADVAPSYAGPEKVSTTEANPFKQTMWYFTEMHLNQADADDILFFGDSLVQGMNMTSLKAKHVNMGIGGYSINEITNRMKAVRIADYRAIIIEGGVNDILVGNSDTRIKESYNDMFRLASNSKRFYFSQMLPVNENLFPGVNERIKSLNLYTAQVCKLFGNCTIIRSPS